VDVRIEGTPANGYEVYGTQPSKSTVTITGPVSHVNQLQRAPTETIAVDGRKDTFTATRVAIAIPDEKIDAVDTTIDVTVDIGEKRVEKKLDNVPVRSALGGNVAPSNATVTIAAPAHLVDQLNASNLTIVVEKTSKGETVPKLQSSGVPIDRLKLVSITPSVFH
jgi:YbbR domain-containing protein